MSFPFDPQQGLIIARAELGRFVYLGMSFCFPDE
jgi:hypothetical protein